MGPSGKFLHVPVFTGRCVRDGGWCVYTRFPKRAFRVVGGVLLLPPALQRWGVGTAQRRRRVDGSYLVDPASSHMLVSKIKPCMSKYKLLCIVKLRMAH